MVDAYRGAADEFQRTRGADQRFVNGRRRADDERLGAFNRLGVDGIKRKTLEFEALKSPFCEENLLVADEAGQVRPSRQFPTPGVARGPESTTMRLVWFATFRATR